jgi:hypothetical protein
MDCNNGFQGKRQLFSPKVAKIAENSVLNIVLQFLFKCTEEHTFSFVNLEFTLFLEKLNAFHVHTYRAKNLLVSRQPWIFLTTKGFKNKYIKMRMQQRDQHFKYYVSLIVNFPTWFSYETERRKEA